MNNQKQQECLAGHGELLSQSDLRQQSPEADSWIEPHIMDGCQFEDDDLMEMEPNIDDCHCSLNDLDHEEMPLDLKDQDTDYICPKCKDECLVRFALKLLGLTHDRGEDNK